MENLEERERHLSDREAEHAEALKALENSRKALEGAATFVQVRSLCQNRVRFISVFFLVVRP